MIINSSSSEADESPHKRRKASSSSERASKRGRTSPTGRHTRKTHSPERKCRYFQRGSCKFGSQCNFLHPDSVCLSFSKFGFCQNENCKLSHPTKHCNEWMAGYCARGRKCMKRHDSELKNSSSYPKSDGRNSKKRRSQSSDSSPSMVERSKKNRTNPEKENSSMMEKINKIAENQSFLASALQTVGGRRNSEPSHIQNQPLLEVPRGNSTLMWNQDIIRPPGSFAPFYQNHPEGNVPMMKSQMFYRN